MPVPVKTASDASSIEAKLDIIAEHLKHIDARDKIRMYGSFLRSMIMIIPTLVFIWSMWYFANHAAEIMKTIASQAASAAAEYTKDSSQGMLDDLLDKYDIKKPAPK